MTEDRKQRVFAYLFLSAGPLAASQSGNIIRMGTAHPVAIATWRLILATVVMAPFAIPRMMSAESAKCGRGEIGAVAVAGIALALHFFAWISAVQWGTVANALIFFSYLPAIPSTTLWQTRAER